MTKTIIGIDPGITGAFSILSPDGILIEDLPVMMKGRGSSRVKNQINPAELFRLLKPYDDAIVYLESVSSMTGQGVASMFSMGDTFGAVRSVVACLHFQLQLITPQKWKAFYRLSKEKELARAMAIQLYPDLSGLLSRKKDHNRAESLLIASYGDAQERFKHGR